MSLLSYNSLEEAVRESFGNTVTIEKIRKCSGGYCNDGAVPSHAAGIL